MLAIDDTGQIDAKSLWHEIMDAEKLRDQYLAVIKPILARWVAKHYRQDLDSPDQRPTLENSIDSYLRYVLTQIAHDRPVCTVEPDSDATDTATAEGMEGAINHWIKRFNYKTLVLRRMARDLVLSWGVTKTYYGLSHERGALKYLEERSSPIPGAWPCTKTVPIDCHFVDARCETYERRRLEGDKFDVDLADLYGDLRYDQNIVRELQPNDAKRERAGSPFPNLDKQATRKLITLYEVWLPEHGRIVTLVASGSDGARIIRSEEYVGPATGPYALWGAMEVPGQVYPFSPIAATYQQFDDLNLFAAVTQQSARKYKKFAVYDKNLNQDGKEVQKVKHGEMTGLASPNSVVDKEIGGVSAQQITVLQMLQERMERNLGMGKLQQGMESGDTATGDTLNQQNADHRIELLRQSVVEGCESDFKKAGWYFFNMESIVMSLTLEDRSTGQQYTVDFYGGQFDQQFLETYDGGPGMAQPGAFAGQAGKEWEDYNLTVRAESLARVSDPVRQKRATEELQLCMQFAQMGFPINWRRVIDRFGNAYNEKDLSSIILLEADPMTGMVGPAPDPLAGGQQMANQMLGLPRGQQPMGPQMPMQPPMGGPTTIPGVMAGATAGVGPR